MSEANCSSKPLFLTRHFASDNVRYRGGLSESKATPHDKRSGQLKKGNSPDDFGTAERCAAKTRRSTPCVPSCQTADASSMVA